MLKTVSLLVTFVGLNILYATSSTAHDHGVSPLPASEQVSNLTAQLPNPQPITQSKTSEISLASTVDPSWSLSVPEPSSLPTPQIDESTSSATTTPSPTPQSKTPKIIASTNTEESSQTSVSPTPTPASIPTAAPATTQAPTSKPTPTTVDYTGTTPPESLDANKIFSLVNNYRTSINLPTFQKDARSCNLAASRAPEINHEIAIGHMHIGLKNRNLNYWNTENIISMNSEQAAFNWWMNDKIHHDAIVGNYQYSCVACYKNACAEEFTNFESKI